jgi:hypothetical protein
MKLYYKIPIILVILGIIIPMILSPFATPQEINSNNIRNLSFKSQIMHMMVLKNKIILSSSIFIGAISFCATYIALRIKI